MFERLVSCFPRGREKVLLRAAEDGRLDTVRKLLAAGVNPNVASEGDFTVLMWAAARGHLEVVGLLLESGADPDAQTDKGRTALEIAIQEGHDDIADLLRKDGGMGDHSPNEEDRPREPSASPTVG